MLRLSCLLFVLLVLAITLPAQTSTTFSAQTANNTAGCGGSPLPAHCYSAFVGMSSRSGIYNAPTGNTSRLDLHPYLYTGSSTRLFAHFQPWFCMLPGSTETGTGTQCNGHVQVGYNSNDEATVAAQLADMQSRGLAGVAVDWYGPNKMIEEGTSGMVKAGLEAQCSGDQQCPMLMVLMEDQGAWDTDCPPNGNGQDQTECITQHLDADLDYMNANYFSSPAYLKVDSASMAPSASGRPVVLFFICESCFTDPVPNWSLIWNSVRAHVQSYAAGSPLLWFIFRNAVGFTHTQTDGAFAWVNHYGKNDPYGYVYLDDFYNSSLKYPSLQTWGAAWKGFDNTNAAWGSSSSITPQQCGQTWLHTLAEETHNDDYSINRQLPFMGIVSWNDYDEGTEIETGIDNCISISAALNGNVLSWNLNASDSSASETTIDHYRVFDSVDGQDLTEIASLLPGSNMLDLSSVTLGTGDRILYVEAVGKPGIHNQMSGPVPYPASAPVQAEDFAISAAPGNRTVSSGKSTSYSITITPVNGFNTPVSLAVSGLPANTSATFDPASTTSASTLMVTTSKTTPSVSATLTITGAAGQISHDATVKLRIK